MDCPLTALELAQFNQTPEEFAKSARIMLAAWEKTPQGIAARANYESKSWVKRASSGGRSKQKQHRQLDHLEESALFWARFPEPARLHREAPSGAINIILRREKQPKHPVALHPRLEPYRAILTAVLKENAR